jgi:hypothetical protein
VDPVPAFLSIYQLSLWEVLAFTAALAGLVGLALSPHAPLRFCAHQGPLLGLLGTAWGVMNALLSIGAKGTAAIAVVAPGIAEALSTTIAGLLVGIPALIFFNIFLFQNRRIEAVLNHYASELMSRFKRGDLVPPSSYAHGKAGKGADSAGYPLSA